ncbi:MAG: 50S ribosomal protein P1 [Candidatus Nitrosocaldaceae archaeon]
MEYVYAALLLHKLNKDINEDNLKSVVKAAGVEPDEVKVKALVASLSEIDINEALKSAPVAVTAAPAAAEAAAPAAKVEEKKKEEEEKKGEEEAMAGLSALFG